MLNVYPFGCVYKPYLQILNGPFPAAAHEHAGAMSVNTPALRAQESVCGLWVGKGTPRVASILD